MIVDLKSKQKEQILNFIETFFNNFENVNTESLLKLQDILIKQFKIDGIKALSFIEDTLKGSPVLFITINNYDSFNGFAKRYYQQLLEKKTELNYEFFKKLVDWLDKVPAENKLEQAKRLYTYSFLWDIYYKQIDSKNIK